MFCEQFANKRAVHGLLPEIKGFRSLKIFLRNFKKTLDKSLPLCYNKYCHRGVAQVVARYLGVVEAVGSSPVTPTRQKRKPSDSGRFSIIRGVAQLGRALRSGRRSRVFKSRHLDYDREHSCGAAFLLSMRDNYEDRLQKMPAGRT